MGNYRGTTRCGYCHEVGHNKAGCPKLKARIEELRETDPNHYMVQREDAKAEKRTARATGKRVCAYCQTHRKTIDQWDWRSMEDSDRAASGCVEAKAKDRWGDMRAWASSVTPSMVLEASVVWVTRSVHASTARPILPSVPHRSKPRV